MSTPQVVVAGSGFAGLQTAFRLRSVLRPDQAELTVITDRDDFAYTPDRVHRLFSVFDELPRVPLTTPLRRRHITYRMATVDGIDPRRRVVHVASGPPVPYDYLVIATGSRARPDEVAGLSAYAYQVGTPRQLRELGEKLQWVVANARHGHEQDVLFLVPPHTSWPGPLYETALMLDTWLHRHQARYQVNITFTTHERSFGQPLGPKVHEVIEAEFEKRHIHGHTDTEVTKVGGQEIYYTDDSVHHFHVLITTPPRVPALRYDGLPTDERGFLDCDPATRAVRGHPEIFAPGDAGDFPVKHATLSLREADAVAATITARILGTDPSVSFRPVVVDVLDTLDNAIHVHVPLTLPEGPTTAVTVAPHAAMRYHAETRRIWRPARKALGSYLRWRFRHGRPIHLGAG